MTRFGLMGVLLLCACGQPSGESAQRETPSETAVAPGKAPARRASGLFARLSEFLARRGSQSGRPGHRHPLEQCRRAGNRRHAGGGRPFLSRPLCRSGVPVRADTMTPTGGIISVGRDGEVGAMLTITGRGGKTRITVIRARRAR